MPDSVYLKDQAFIQESAIRTEKNNPDLILNSPPDCLILRNNFITILWNFWQISSKQWSNRVNNKITQVLRMGWYQISTELLFEQGKSRLKAGDLGKIYF